MHLEKKKPFPHLEKRSCFPSLFLAQAKMRVPGAALTAGPQKEYVWLSGCCVWSALCADHDRVGGVQLRKLMSRDAAHGHLVLMVLTEKLFL